MADINRTSLIGIFLPNKHHWGGTTLLVFLASWKVDGETTGVKLWVETASSRLEEPIWSLTLGLFRLFQACFSQRDYMGLHGTTETMAAVVVNCWNLPKNHYWLVV